jgi:hypothetical protein
MKIKHILAVLVALSLEAQATPLKPLRQAEISPQWPLCTATRYGGWPDRTLWLRWSIAQQADGGQWTHSCVYDEGTQL